MHTYERERAVALAAVREAAQLCRTVQGRLAPETLEKKDRSPVTVADFGSQALVCRALREAFPDDPIIAEEDATALRGPDQAVVLERVVNHVQALRPEADAETACRWIDYGNAAAYSDRFWTLDPIDGTKGFLRGEQYAVALALIVEGEVTVAALACPNLGPEGVDPQGPGTVYMAVRGQGTTVASLADDSSEEIVRVSATTDPAEARFCESVESGHTAHGDAASVADALGISAPPVRLDSQAKYAVLARGEADIYLRLPTRPGYVEKIWDHAAGALVIMEAGGRVTDMHGQPLAFDRGPRLEANQGIIASNGHLHDAVLEALAAVGVSAP